MTDLKFAARQLLKNKGFAAVAVLTLALGIGANATILSIVNSILIRPIRALHPEQLVGVYQHERKNPNAYALFSYPDFADLRATSNSPFADLFAFGRASVALQRELTKEIPVNLVSANFFSALGISAEMGRTFLPDEETSGAPVAVLTHSFWTKLGADPAIIGQKLKLTRGEVNVIGVMPKGFTGAQMLAPDMFLPLGTSADLTSGPGDASQLSKRGDHRFMLMARLKQGMNLRNVGSALAVMSEQYPIADPGQPKDRILMCAPPSRFNFSAGPDRKKGGLTKVAGFAFGLSALVLIIACFNLANVMLARGSSRRKEIAVRLALGARRSRVIRQLLTEGFLLALLGSVAGVLVSFAATKLLATFIYSGAGMPADFPIFNFAPDWRVFVVLLLLGGLATLFFALGPAWKLVRLDVNSDLKQHTGEDARASGFRRISIRNMLAIGQMAFSLALLIAASLFIRSAIKAYDANPGFAFGSNFYVAINPALSGYPGKRAWELNREATEKLSALPGVESVSSASSIPFGVQYESRRVQLGGAPAPNDQVATLADGGTIEAQYNVVGANYFQTLGIPLLNGRGFERHEGESTNASPVAIISQNLADQLWPGTNTLGRTIQFPTYDKDRTPTLLTIVGVVPASHWRLFEGKAPSEVFVPLIQDLHPDFKLLVRVAPGMDPVPLMNSARDELRRLDANIPITAIKTLKAMHQDGPNVRVTEFASILFGTFGALALFLSALGVYGLRAYAVSRRAREIGIRMAIGATGKNVVRMLVREGLWLAVFGLGIGVPLALAVGKIAGRYLYQVSSIDPLSFAAMPLFLVTMAWIACWLPARRAANVDPIEALRNE
ncbi:FtsX-like permease family protein [bacterium]|nr:FtsX-like permease family protein [bacterium]